MQKCLSVLHVLAKKRTHVNKLVVGSVCVLQAAMTFLQHGDRLDVQWTKNQILSSITYRSHLKAQLFIRYLPNVGKCGVVHQAVLCLY